MGYPGRKQPQEAPVVAQEGALRAGPRDGEGTASLSASRTVLVVTPESTRAGEVVGALQDRGVPSIQASTPPQATHDGVLSSSIGTSGVLFAHADEAAVDPSSRIHAFAHAVPGCYCLLAVTLS